MADDIPEDAYYLLGRLLTECNEHIASYYKYSDLSTSSFSVTNVREQLATLESLGLASDASIGGGQGRRSTRLIMLTPRGLAFSVQNADRILVVTANGGASEHYNQVRQALRRLGALGSNIGPLEKFNDSSSWTGRSERFSISAQRQDEIVERLRGVEKSISTLPMSQAEQEQVRAHVAAALVLSGAPTPPWPLVLQILSAIGGVATIAGTVAAIVALIIGH